MIPYSVAVVDIARLVQGPRVNGELEQTLVARLQSLYFKRAFYCEALEPLNGLALKINRECSRLQNRKAFRSPYLTNEYASVEVLRDAIAGRAVSLEAILKINASLSAISSRGKSELREWVLHHYPTGALPNECIRLDD